MIVMLYITLKQTSNKDTSCYFTVKELSLPLIAEVRENPVMDINIILEKLWQICTEGGIGMALVMLHIVEFCFADRTPTVLQGRQQEMSWMNILWQSWVFIGYLLVPNGMYSILPQAEFSIESESRIHLPIATQMGNSSGSG